MDELRNSSATAGRCVLLLASFAPSLVNFRGELIKELVASGLQVLCCAPEEDTQVRAQLREWGAEYTAAPMQRNRLAPFSDALYALRLWRVMRRLQPDLVLAYTVKPVVFGLLAARMAGIRRRAALITGVGYAFAGGSMFKNALQGVVRLLYRAALHGANPVIFQNPDDQAEFVGLGLCTSEVTTRVHGSGVDLDQFTAISPPPGPVHFLLVARLLKQKGILEYLEAARIVRAEISDAVFTLVGPEDTSPDGISVAEIRRWESSGIVHYLGTLSDVRPALRECAVFVLPSYYREGLPRTILEAMATGRPIITTNAPGCRETVDDGVNGFLVPPRDPEALARAMLDSAASEERRWAMGQASRRMAEERYDVRLVNTAMLDALGIVGQARSTPGEETA